jgi:hypothetical protein
MRPRPIPDCEYCAQLYWNDDNEELAMISDKAQGVLAELVQLFEEPDKLVGIISEAFIPDLDPDKPMNGWSLANRMMVVMHRTTDARTFKQWQAVGRSVKKGVHAFYLLAPCFVKEEYADKVTKQTEERLKLVGYRGFPVFRVEDTDGEALPSAAPAVFPPLMEVAEAWGVGVRWLGGAKGVGLLGVYSKGEKEIVLLTHGQATWFHELAHAADDAVSGMEGDKAEKEAVAELSAAVLARLYGLRMDRSSWLYIEHYAGKNAMGLVRSVLPRVEMVLAEILSKTNRSEGGDLIFTEEEEAA